MRYVKITCDKCLKDITLDIKNGEIGLLYSDSRGYGSKYDGLDVEIDLCNKCFDQLCEDLNVV